VLKCCCKTSKENKQCTHALQLKQNTVSTNDAAEFNDARRLVRVARHRGATNAAGAAIACRIVTVRASSSRAFGARRRTAHIVIGAANFAMLASCVTARRVDDARRDCCRAKLLRASNAARAAAD
jgi:cyanophycinase-like exopeptidase